VDQRLGRTLIAYLDTCAVVWLAQNDVRRLSPAAIDAINLHDLLVSPMVSMELAYLREVGKVIRAPRDILRQLHVQIGLKTCPHPFPEIMDVAADESWSRDPFDRVIVAHAKANGYAPLVTADEKIRRNYPRAIW
jgi:PIN domain nuclease of toxin-antitoxin system